MSVFFIKFCLVSVGAEQDVRHPVRRPSHLITDRLQVNSGVAFNNQFIMDVPDNKAVPERLHGVAEDVATNGLDDILHELRTIGFNAFPLLCRPHAFISDGLSAELIRTDPGLHI